MGSMEPSQDTIRRLASLQESDEEDEGEGEGTAKISNNTAKPTPAIAPSAEMRNSVSTNRLSSLFGGWLTQPTTTTEPSIATASASSDRDKRKSIVSEPKLVEQHHIGPAQSKPKANRGDGNNGTGDEEEEEDLDESGFNDLLARSFRSIFYSY